MFEKLRFVPAACIFACAAVSANAACIDVKQTDQLSFQGTLSRQVFPGRPNFEDVRKGDAREPGYILKLDAPICATGDEFLNAGKSFDRIQLVLDDAPASSPLPSTLRGLTGKRVVVEGRSAFGAHTGHHHAPLLVAVKNIAGTPAPTR